jgi:large-conductance mechanosensitive channel
MEEQPSHNKKKSRTKKDSVVMKDKESKNTCIKKSVLMFRKFDIFGERVQFTFKGEDTFKTTYGAMVTTVIGLILLAFSIFRIYIMANKMNPNITRTSLFRNLTEAGPF